MPSRCVSVIKGTGLGDGMEVCGSGREKSRMIFQVSVIKSS